MTTMEFDTLISKIDGPMFCEQRQVVSELIDDPNMLTSDIRALEGLQNLLDCIADYAHDVHGVDCLFTEDPEDEWTYEEWQWDVSNGDTKLGFDDWVQHNIESHKGDLK